MPDPPVVPHARLNAGSIYGMIGFLAALAIHESTFTASTLTPNNPLFWAMHAGIFPLFFPMVWGLRKWSETSAGAFGMATRRLRWRDPAVSSPMGHSSRRSSFRVCNDQLRSRHEPHAAARSRWSRHANHGSGAGAIPRSGLFRPLAHLLRDSHAVLSLRAERASIGFGWPDFVAHRPLTGDYRPGCSCRSIHDVPNRSRSIANRDAKNVSSIFMKTCPPSASSAYTRSASAAVSSVSVT
jgi:hypothetical protein